MSLIQLATRIDELRGRTPNKAATSEHLGLFMRALHHKEPDALTDAELDQAEVVLGDLVRRLEAVQP